MLNILLLNIHSRGKKRILDPWILMDPPGSAFSPLYPLDKLDMVAVVDFGSGK
jgi:hypothetical protein